MKELNSQKVKHLRRKMILKDWYGMDGGGSG